LQSHYRDARGRGAFGNRSGSVKTIEKQAVSVRIPALEAKYFRKGGDQMTPFEFISLALVIVQISIALRKNDRI
jgi:hypothetical protein